MLIFVYMQSHIYKFVCAINSTFICPHAEELWKLRLTVVLELKGQEIDSTYTIPVCILLDPTPKIIEDILDYGKKKKI